MSGLKGNSERKPEKKDLSYQGDCRKEKSYITTPWGDCEWFLSFHIEEYYYYN